MTSDQPSNVLPFARRAGHGRKLAPSLPTPTRGCVVDVAARNTASVARRPERFVLPYSAVAGDPNSMSEQAFSAIWQQHESSLRALLRAQLGSTDLAFDELLQELRLKLWQLIRQQPQATVNSSYLRKLVISVVVDGLRRARARREECLEEALVADPAAFVQTQNQAPEEQLDLSQRQQQLLEALARLPERRRAAAALLLRGFNPQEIALMLQISEASARNSAYRGVDELKLALSGGGLSTPIRIGVQHG